MSDANTNTPAVRRQPTTIGELLESKKGSLALVATRHLTPEKLIKIVGVMMSRVPKLGHCTPMSVLTCVMTCAELGLAPSTLGTAYLIPYENRKAGTLECQLIIGYRGLMELARRSGFITTIQAEVVREGDVFELEYTTDGTAFKHTPKAGPEAKVIGVWALAKFRDEGHQFAYMTRAEIDSIRNRSKSGQNGPWVTDFGEMAKKTVLRRLCKYLPLTVEVEQAVADVDRTEFNFDQIAGEPVAGEDDDEPKTSMDAVRDAAAAKAGKAPATETPKAEEPKAAAPAPAAQSAPAAKEQPQHAAGVVPEEW